MNRLLTAAIALIIAAPLAASPAHKLIKRMRKLQTRGIMIGHQDDPMYGHEWQWTEGKSDIKDVCGDYPAVMGFDLGHLELGHDKNLDGVSFNRIRKEAIAQYERGGIVTLSWHPDNPVTGKNAWDSEGHAVTSVLPGGASHQKFMSWLDAVAQFISSLRDRKGRLIPIIFRPWHEMNGGWFWWGSKSCSPDELRQLYRMTHDIMLKKYHLNNIVWAYSPNLGATEMDTYYPGDAYTDLVGIDIYNFDHNAEAYKKNVADGMKLITTFARKHHKLAAFTETGSPGLDDATWFTQTLMPLIQNYDICYVLFWRNAYNNKKEIYVAYPGQSSEKDFIKFYQLKRTLFLQDINKK